MLLNYIDSLRFINFDDNQIVMIPPGISDLKNLYEISVKNNKIERVYYLDGEKLIYLNRIDLSNNRLTKIDYTQGFHSLRSLTKLMLGNNPITHIEGKVLGILYTMKLSRFKFDWEKYLPPNKKVKG